MKNTALTDISIHWVQRIAQRWHHPWVRLLDTYHPERRYMRGPGPRSPKVAPLPAETIR